MKDRNSLLRQKKGLHKGYEGPKLPFGREKGPS
jgi:hypothetical protein